MTYLEPPLSPDIRERILLLSREGMPSTWIAEDCGVASGKVRAIARAAGVPSSVGDWRSVWGSIRNKIELHALHIEFAPRQVRK